MAMGTASRAVASIKSDATANIVALAEDGVLVGSSNGNGNNGNGNGSNKDKDKPKKSKDDLEDFDSP